LLKNLTVLHHHVANELPFFLANIFKQAKKIAKVHWHFVTRNIFLKAKKLPNCTSTLFVYKHLQKGLMVSLNDGVNFINVKHAFFSYEWHFGSFFSSYMYIVKAAETQRSYEKFVRLTLMKLTHGVNRKTCALCDISGWKTNVIFHGRHFPLSFYWKRRSFNNKMKKSIFLVFFSFLRFLVFFKKMKIGNLLSSISLTFPHPFSSKVSVLKCLRWFQKST